MIKVRVDWKGNRINNNNWEEIVQLLDRGPKEGDIFSMDNFSLRGGQAERLSIEFDEETTLFMPIMRVDLNKPFYMYDNPEADGTLVEFAGADMDNRFFTEDFELIKSMVREFYETGWVKVLKPLDELD